MADREPRPRDVVDAISDPRSFFRRHHDEYSNRKIASATGVSESTVRRWRKEMVPVGTCTLAGLGEVTVWR